MVSTTALRPVPGPEEEEQGLPSGRQALLRAMEQLVSRVAGWMRFDTLSLGIVDDAQEKIFIFSLSMGNIPPGTMRAILPATEPGFGPALEDQLPGLVDTAVDPAGTLAGRLGAEQDCSVLVVPILLYDRLVGTLNLGRKSSEPYEKEDVQAARRFMAEAARAAAGLILHHRIQVSEQVARRAYDQLTEFSRVGSLIVQEKDLDRICNLFMQALQDHAVFQRGILTLLDDELKGYKWFFFGMSDEEIEYFHSHSSNKMTREQRSRIFQEKYRVGNSYYIPSEADWEYTGVKSRRSDVEMVDWHPDDFLFIPLYGSHKRLVGVVSVDDPRDGRSPSAETLSSLELFANQVAHAIEEKKLDSEVKKSTRKYKTLVETMNDGLVVMDLSERITLVNPTLCKLVGYRVEEMISSSLYTFLSEYSRATVMSKKDERRLGIKSRYEVELQSKDGASIPVLMSGAPLYESNRLVGSFAVMSDLREQKKAEAEFRSMHGEIMEANKKLQDSMDRLKTTQEQLVQAEKLSAIGELVSGVAHELNNPLTGVLGYAQLLLTREAPEGFRKQLETIYSEAIRCRKIVQNLLTFARKHKPEKRSVNINEILEATLELRAYQLRVDNISVVKELAEDLGSTMADYHQMQQVFINLINNAHQAMLEDKGKGTLTISSAVERDRIVVTFQDDGPGIPGDSAGRIFDPFFTTKEIGKGTGLGLSLSYGIIKEHGGTITVHNVGPGKGNGRGAIFRVELPVRDTAAQEPEIPVRWQGQTLQEGKKILLVDDEKTVLQLLSDLLSSRGHQVEVAGDGEEALRRLRTEKPGFDLIISDMKMPVMDGRQLYDAVMSFSPVLARRMIFTTGDTVSEDARGFLLSTGNPFISKPFQLDEVEQLIGAVFEEELEADPSGAGA
ncbi:MAG: ATP-binding protein [Acidobacteriota bacterium]